MVPEVARRTVGRPRLHCGGSRAISTRSSQRRVEGADRLSLVPRGETLTVRGDVSVLVPPEARNAGTVLAISLHVYRADIAARGTSINHTFPDELVATNALVDGVHAWRRLIA